MQKARGQAIPGPKSRHSPPTACRHTVSGTLSLPSQGFFSPFPHGTGSLSVAKSYLALRDGPRRFPRDFTCPAVLRNARESPSSFHLRGYHTLWPTFPSRSASCRIGNSPVLHGRAPYNPQPSFEISNFKSEISKEGWVWAVPLSLAATGGIAVAFSSSRY